MNTFQEKTAALAGFKEELLKEAGKWQTVKDVVSKGGDAVKSMARSAKEGYKNPGKKAKNLAKDSDKAFVSENKKSYNAGRFVAKNKKAIGAATAVGAGGYALGRAGDNKTTVVYK